LKANGHGDAHRYPLGKLANEDELLRTIKRREMAFRMVADQHVGSAVFSGGKKGIRAYEKFLRDLED
jgi:hypothetical protein